MYVIGCIVGAILSFLVGFRCTLFSKEQYVPFRNGYGVIVGYRETTIPPNTFIQYVAAHTNYKPVFDAEGNVEGFRFQRAQTTVPLYETDDPTPTT